VDGLSVLRAAKSDPRTRVIPVVVPTSFREEKEVVSSFELGANSYVQKPMDFEEFRDLVAIICVYWLEICPRPSL
jgi:two-component system response regulator